MSIFLVLFFIVIIIGVFVLSIGLSLLRGVFSFFTPKRKSTTSHTDDTYQKEKTTQSKQHEKIFSKDEGEYIDYEEID